MAARLSPYARVESLLRRAAYLDVPDADRARVDALVACCRLYADHCDDDAVYPAIEALMVVLCDLVEPAIEAAERTESVGGGS